MTGFVVRIFMELNLFIAVFFWLNEIADLQMTLPLM